MCARWRLGKKGLQVLFFQNLSLSCNSVCVNKKDSLLIKGVKIVRDAPLEKLWGERGGELFSLSNYLYEFLLGPSLNIF